MIQSKQTNSWKWANRYVWCQRQCSLSEKRYKSCQKVQKHWIHMYRMWPGSGPTLLQSGFWLVILMAYIY